MLIYSFWPNFIFYYNSVLLFSLPKTFSYYNAQVLIFVIICFLFFKICPNFLQTLYSYVLLFFTASISYFWIFLHLLLHLIFTAFVFLQKYFSQNFYKAFTYFSNKHLVNHGKRLSGLTAWVIFIWFYLRSWGWCGSTPPYFDDIFSFLDLSLSTSTSTSFPLNAFKSTYGHLHISLPFSTSHHLYPTQPHFAYKSSVNATLATTSSPLMKKSVWSQKKWRQKNRTSI